MGARQSMKNDTIGLRVQKARKLRMYSQEKLGDKAELTQQHISRIENNEISPTVDTLLKIAKALEVSITSLTDEEILIVEERCIIEMIGKLQLLTMDSKMKVSGYIDCLYQDEMRKYGIKRKR